MSGTRAGAVTGDEHAAAARQQAARNIGHPLTRALLMLTFSTGVVDAASFRGLGHVFTANMTGNVVLLGSALLAPSASRWWRP